MADDASRLFELSDELFLTYFNRVYPQNNYWESCHLPGVTSSLLTSILSQGRSQPASALPESGWRKVLGSCGANSAAHNSRQTRAHHNFKTQSWFSYYLGSDCETAGWPRLADLSSLDQWRTASVQWARRSPQWGPWTHARTSGERSTSG